MSNAWDLRCVTCNESAGFEWNHGDKALAALWEAREQIAAIPSIKIDGLEVKVEHYFGDIRPWWFAQHKDHDVRLRDEYGRYGTDCLKQARCGSCGHMGNCRRPPHHEGECSPIEPSTSHAQR